MNYTRYSYGLFIFLSFAPLLFADVAFASHSGSTDVIGSQMCNIVNILQGTTAKAVCTVAIISSAGMFVAGNIKWDQLMMICSGVVIIFSATQIVLMISGASVGCVSTVSLASGSSSISGQNLGVDNSVGAMNDSDLQPVPNTTVPGHGCDLSCGAQDPTTLPTTLTPEQMQAIQSGYVSLGGVNHSASDLLAPTSELMAQVAQNCNSSLTGDDASACSYAQGTINGALQYIANDNTNGLSSLTTLQSDNCRGSNASVSSTSSLCQAISDYIPSAALNSAANSNYLASADDTQTAASLSSDAATGISAISSYCNFNVAPNSSSMASTCLNSANALNAVISNIAQDPVKGQAVLQNLETTYCSGSSGSNNMLSDVCQNISSGLSH